MKREFEWFNAYVAFTNVQKERDFEIANEALICNFVCFYLNY